MALHESVALVFAAVARERSLPTRAPTEECRRTLRAAGVRTPDLFYDRFYAENARFETVETILNQLPDGTSELMCHPGFADDELKGSSTYAEEREREVEVLCDPRVRGLVRANGVALVGFEAV